MIADLVNDKLKIRLITRNVMSVYSANKEYTDNFIRILKHSDYIVNKNKVSSTNIISYIIKNYNQYENIFRYIKSHNNINLTKFSEYLNFFNLNHLLWLHFYQLTDIQLKLVELLIQLSSDYKIIITDYIDQLAEYTPKLYTLLFHVGLEDKLIIVPFNKVEEAVNNSTCQCYVKSNNVAKIQAAFSSEFINSEFNTDKEYYKDSRPIVYKKDSNYIIPKSYTYCFYELLLILIFSIKMLYITFYNWRTRVHVT